MLLFFWLLFSLGVAYGAKTSRRNPAGWFIVSVALTPLAGSLLLMLANRYGVRLANIL